MSATLLNMEKEKNTERKHVKKEWKTPALQIIPFKNTRGGENPTWNEITAGDGYNPTPSY